MPAICIDTMVLRRLALAGRDVNGLLAAIQRRQNHRALKMRHLKATRVMHNRDNATAGCACRRHVRR